jgi:hypothetical protein
MRDDFAFLEDSVDEETARETKRLVKKECEEEKRDQHCDGEGGGR